MIWHLMVWLAWKIVNGQWIQYNNERSMEAKKWVNFGGILKISQSIEWCAAAEVGPGVEEEEEVRWAKHWQMNVNRSHGRQTYRWLWIVSVCPSPGVRSAVVLWHVLLIQAAFCQILHHSILWGKKVTNHLSGQCTYLHLLCRKSSLSSKT